MGTYKNFKQTIVLFEGIEQMKPVEIHLPDPPNQSKIANRNMPQEKQMFYRTTMPARFNQLPDKDRKEFIAQEWKRRIDGYWFWNNGQLRHLTGTHYLYANWWRTMFGFPDFRVTDAEYFYLWKHIVQTDWCFGMANMEARQGGKSSRAAVIIYDDVTKAFNAWGGIQSKTDADAEDFFRRKIIYCWKRLPYFFQPRFDNTSDPKYELRFFAPTKRGSLAKIEMGDWDTVHKNQHNKIDFSKLELASTVDFRASNIHSYDGSTLYRYISDEAGKCDAEVDVVKRWDVVKPALLDKGKMIVKGKSIHTTTVEEMDKKGGKQWKIIWDSSHPDKNTTGLMQYFVPVERCMYINKFGEPDVAKAKLWWDTTYDKLPWEQRADFRRKNPRNIKDCFAIPGGEAFFNNHIIDMAIDNTMYAPKTTPGDFKWMMKDQAVYFEPNEHGRFKVSYLFETPSFANAQEMLNGVRYPTNTNFGVAGCDTFSKGGVGAGGEKRQRWHSDGGICGFRKRDWAIDRPDEVPYEITNETGKDTIKINHVTERFMFTYRFRPLTPEEFYEDVLKVCVYYGIQVYPENNAGAINDYFIKRGYAGYLYFDVNRRTRKFEVEAGDRTDEKVKQQLFLLWRTHIENNGIREVHPELLTEVKEVDEDMNKYDMFVAGGYALLASSKQEVVPVIQSAKMTKDDFFEEYTY